jgi:hypothetical protein
MYRCVLFAFMIASSAAAHAQTVYDLKNDWSDNANPNGVWQYRAATTNLVHAPDWTNSSLGYVQPVWTTSSFPTAGVLCPAVFKATSRSTVNDYAPGDIVMQPNTPPCGNDIDAANVAWTAPFDASINVSGNLWQTGLRSGANSRNDTAILHLNGVILQTITNLAGFSSSSPAYLSVSNVSVHQGETLWLSVVRYPNTIGELIDLNMHIIATPALPALGEVVLPQFAFGGGWESALYFTNTGTSATSFTVNFIGDDGAPLTLPSLGASATTVNLAPLGTAFIEAPNSGPLNGGYVQTTLPGGVVGYGVFRQSVSGIADQEAVVQLSGASTTTNTLIWDDTAFVTGVAVVNLSSATTVVSIDVRDSSGNDIGIADVSIPAKGKKAFFLRDLPGLSKMSGRRGSATFTAAIANIAVLGLRFNGPAFTSIPTIGR